MISLDNKRCIQLSNFRAQMASILESLPKLGQRGWNGKNYYFFLLVVRCKEDMLSACLRRVAQELFPVQTNT